MIHLYYARDVAASGLRRRSRAIRYGERLARARFVRLLVVGLVSRSGPLPPAAACHAGVAPLNRCLETDDHTAKMAACLRQEDAAYRYASRARCRRMPRI